MNIIVSIIKLIKSGKLELRFRTLATFDLDLFLLIKKRTASAVRSYHMVTRTGFEPVNACVKGM